MSCIGISDRCNPQNVFVAWHPMLIKVFIFVLTITGEAVITSAKRFEKIHKFDTGIHCTDPLRALDIRYYIYSNPEFICDTINEKFTYDPLRPDMKCAILHTSFDKDGKSLGRHIHLQVHSRTRENGNIKGCES